MDLKKSRPLGISLALYVISEREKKNTTIILVEANEQSMNLSHIVYDERDISNGFFLFFFH